MDDQADGEALPEPSAEAGQVPAVPLDGCRRQLDLDTRELPGATVLDDQVDLRALPVPEVRQVDRAPAPGGLLVRLGQGSRAQARRRPPDRRPPARRQSAPPAAAGRGAARPRAERPRGAEAPPAKRRPSRRRRTRPVVGGCPWPASRPLGSRPPSSRRPALPAGQPYRPAPLRPHDRRGSWRSPSAGSGLAWDRGPRRV